MAPPAVNNWGHLQSHCGGGHSGRGRPQRSIFNFVACENKRSEPRTLRMTISADQGAFILLAFGYKIVVEILRGKILFGPVKISLRAKEGPVV
jgi:hypothetical protein